MRRLARHTSLSALSLLLCVAACGLWVRSRFRHDHLYRLQPAVTQDGPGWDSLSVASAGGRLTVFRQVAALWLFETRTAQARSGKWGWHRVSHTYEPTSPRGTLAERFGFRYERRGRGPQFERHWYIGAPHWLVAAVFAVLPAVRAASALRRTRRARRGLCTVCGYDLRVQLALSEQRESSGRASPGRCPECGAEHSPAV